jgi:hypothetical protein
LTLRPSPYHKEVMRHLLGEAEEVKKWHRRVPENMIPRLTLTDTELIEYVCDENEKDYGT